MKLIGKLVGGVFKLIALPFKLLFKTVALFLKLSAKTAFLPVRAGRATTRTLGFKGLLLGLFGLAIGLLFAPMPGRELREKLLAMLSGGGSVPDDELADKVSFELSHAPRTWHLEPQPEVSVLAGRVVLSGEVRGDDARDEFARVAAAVPGVIAVDNQLEVAVAGAEGGSE